MKTMILVFPRFEDIPVWAGITVRKYLKNGWKIHAVSVFRSSQMTLPDISNHLNLDYTDKPIKNIPAGELEDIFDKLFVEICPDVIITTGPYDILNNPDRSALSNMVTYAFQRYCFELEQTRTFVSDVNDKKKNVKARYFAAMHKFALKQESFEKLVESDTDPKLYFCCVPRAVASYLKKIHILPAMAEDKPVTGVEDKTITTVIDGSAYAKDKITMMATGRTNNTLAQYYLGSEKNPLLVSEYFRLRMQGTTEVFMGKNDRVADKL